MVTLTWYHTRSVKVSPAGYEDITQSPVQSAIVASPMSDVWSVGSTNEYLPIQRKKTM